MGDITASALELGGLECVGVHDMPANNFMMVFHKL